MFWCQESFDPRKFPAPRACAERQLFFCTGRCPAEKNEALELDNRNWTLYSTGKMVRKLKYHEQKLLKKVDLYVFLECGRWVWRRTDGWL